MAKPSNAITTAEFSVDCAPRLGLFDSLFQNISPAQFIERFLHTQHKIVGRQVYVLAAQISALSGQQDPTGFCKAMSEVNCG